MWNTMYILEFACRNWARHGGHWPCSLKLDQEGFDAMRLTNFVHIFLAATEYSIGWPFKCMWCYEAYIYTKVPEPRYVVAHNQPTTARLFFCNLTKSSFVLWQCVNLWGQSCDACNSCRFRFVAFNDIYTSGDCIVCAIVFHWLQREMLLPFAGVWMCSFFACLRGCGDV